jgi:lichenan operon transcriptional antiterminator
MLERQKRILRETVANYFGISIQEICTIEKVSERTVRSDIKVINELLNPFHIQISQDGTRYYIDQKSKQLAVQAYRELTKRDYVKELLVTPSDRRATILFKLIETDGYTSMEKLAEDMYTSKATVHAHIHDIEEMIEANTDLELVISSRKGVQLVGSEAGKRMLLSTIFSWRISKNVVNKYISSYLPKETIENSSMILDVVTELLKKKDSRIAFNEIYFVVVSVMIAHYRYQEGHFNDTHDADYQMVSSLQKKLAEYNLIIPISELDYIPYYVQHKAEDQQFQGVTKDIVRNFSVFMKETYQTEFFNEETTKSLLLHVDSIIHSNRISFYSSPTIYDDLVKKYVHAYYLGMKLGKQIEEVINIELSKEDISYLGLHIQSIIKRQLNMNYQVIVYDSNIAVTELLVASLSRHYENRMDCISVYSMWEIDELIQKKNIRLIIATKSIPDYFGGVPLLKVDPFINYKNYDAIDSILFRNHHDYEIGMDSNIIIKKIGEALKISYKEQEYLIKEKEIILHKEVGILFLPNSQINEIVILENQNGLKKLIFCFCNTTMEFQLLHRNANQVGQIFFEQSN